MTERPRCTATTHAGKQCGVMHGISAAGLCMAHDPERRQQMRAVSAAGGRSRAAKAKLPKDVPRAPQTLEDAVQFASWLTHAVCIGTIDARTGRVSSSAVADLPERRPRHRARDVRSGVRMRDRS